MYEKYGCPLRLCHLTGGGERRKRGQVDEDHAQVGGGRGPLFRRRKKDPEKRDGIKMYKRKEAGCCRCQDPICMNGKGLNCRGWGSYPPPPASPHSFFGGGN